MHIIDQVLKEARIEKKAWFPGREEVKYFEQLEENQEQIWPDSADSGVIMNKDADLIEARKHIKELLDIYKAKIDRGPGKDSTTEFFVAFEQDEDNGRYLGETIRIYYHDGGKNKDNPSAPGYDPRFISVDTSRSSQKEPGYKDKKKANINNLPF